MFPTFHNTSLKPGVHFVLPAHFAVATYQELSGPGAGAAVSHREASHHDAGCEEPKVSKFLQGLGKDLKVTWSSPLHTKKWLSLRSPTAPSRTDVPLLGVYVPVVPSQGTWVADGHHQGVKEGQEVRQEDPGRS